MTRELFKKKSKDLLSVVVVVSNKDIAMSHASLVCILHASNNNFIKAKQILSNFI